MRSRSISFFRAGELVEDLLPLQAGEALQLHVEDRLGLDLRQAELRHQPVAGQDRARRGADQRDHGVEVIEGDGQAFEDVGAGLGLLQLELDAPADDVAPELDEVIEQVDQRQHARPAADDGQRDDAEGGLELRVLEQVVQHDVGHFALLQLDDDADAVAIRLVADVGDALEHLLVHQVGDLLLQLRLVDLVGDLGGDDLHPIALADRLDLGLGAQRDRAAAGGVGRVDAGVADDDAAAGEVGPGDRLQDVALPFQTPLFLGLGRRLPGALGLFVFEGQVDDADDRLDHLAQVVRRDVRRHADGDAGRAVDQQVRERRRQDGRLVGRLVVVRDEVDGLLVEVGHHGLGQPLQARLGVAHGRGGVAVHRAEVALAVDQGLAHVEVLRQAHQRVVDGRVAVRVIGAHHVADDLGALAIGAVRRQAHLAHAEQHAAVRGLEAVSYVGQRAPDDHAHGVIHVRALHLVFDVDRDARLGIGHALWRSGKRLRSRSGVPLDVEVLHVEGVVLDELAPRLDLVAHQGREHQVGFRVVLRLDLEQRADARDPSWSSQSCSGFISPRPL